MQKALLFELSAMPERGGSVHALIPFYSYGTQARTHARTHAVGHLACDVLLRQTAAFVAARLPYRKQNTA